MSGALHVAEVTHRYRPGGAPVLDRVSLEVAAGTVTTVLGPSGSGKSTLLSVIAGLEAPEAGDVRIDGVSVRDVPPARRGVAMVLQQPHLFPHLSVGENVTFGLAARGVDRRTRAAEAARWLDLVGLDGMAGRRPRELSGGEQQRVALVRGLAVRPRLLLLDEPLASLDPLVRGALQEVLLRLVRDTGVTTVMVTHDRAEAMVLGDRTALLVGGAVVAEDAPERLYRRPPTRLAAEFLGVSIFIRGVMRDGRVVTSAGPLDVGGALPDGEVTLAVRPEHVTLGTAGGANTVPGRVLDRAFRGEHWDCAVETPLGVIRARSAGAPDTGAPVHVVIPAAGLFPVADGP